MAYIGRQQSSGAFLKLDDISSQFNDSTTTFNLTVGGDAYYPDNPLTKEPDGVTDIPSDVKAVCNLFWTTEIKDAYKVFLEATKQPSS